MAEKRSGFPLARGLLHEKSSQLRRVRFFGGSEPAVRFLRFWLFLVGWFLLNPLKVSPVLVTQLGGAYKWAAT